MAPLNDGGSKANAAAIALIDKAVELIEREGGIRPFLTNVGFGGIVFAFIVQIIDGIRGAGTLLLGPPRALGRGLILLIDTTIGGLVDVFGAGTAATVASFSTGVGSLLGPLAQPAALGVVMITLAIFVFVINRFSISPLSFIQSVRG